jgi:hypothetical protein
MIRATWRASFNPRHRRRRHAIRRISDRSLGDAGGNLARDGAQSGRVLWVAIAVMLVVAFDYATVERSQLRADHCCQTAFCCSTMRFFDRSETRPTSSWTGLHRTSP